MDGVLIVNKPLGKTSFDIVRDVRKEYNTKKVGHIGTLDPMASGVLPILVGKATKLSDYLMDHDKEYIATLKLGIQTNTGDSEGETIEQMPVNSISKKTVQDVLLSFLGESEQIPPMYSAIKVNGNKLYELAREGKTVERKPRKIFIDEIELLGIDFQGNEISFRVVCSKGTYIRTLCEDIASDLGTCGYMKSLKRTRVGNFKIENAGKFIDLPEVLTDVPSITVVNYTMLENGMHQPVGSNISTNYTGLVNLYYENKFVGIGSVKNKYYKRFILI